MPHSVAFYVHSGHQLLDLAGPLDAFHAANAAADRPLYATSVVSVSGGEVCGGTGLPIGTRPATEASANTLIIVGGRRERLRHADEVAMVQRLAARAARIASVCTGAFLLGEAGLLNGRRVTTHWSRANELQRCFPSASVVPDRIFVADGPIWTSAGITSGIDLALALIEADHGTELSRTVSRELVVYHRRPGGQSQFSTLSLLEPDADRMRMALAFAREHLAEPLPLDRLAAAARLSPRQFGRAFRQATGETPAKAVERLRVEAARLRLEEGAESIELIARSVGFGDTERMRRAFVKRIGMSPQAVRQTVRPFSGDRAGA